MVYGHTESVGRGYSGITVIDVHYVVRRWPGELGLLPPTTKVIKILSYVTSGREQGMCLNRCVEGHEWHDSGSLKGKYSYLSRHAFSHGHSSSAGSPVWVRSPSGA
jgi:hypothetical protein